MGFFDCDARYWAVIAFKRMSMSWEMSFEGVVFSGSFKNKDGCLYALRVDWIALETSRYNVKVYAGNLLIGDKIEANEPSQVLSEQIASWFLDNPINYSHSLRTG